MRRQQVQRVADVPFHVQARRLHSAGQLQVRIRPLRADCCGDCVTLSSSLAADLHPSNTTTYRALDCRFNYKDNTLAQMYVHARSCMPFFLISAVGKSSDSKALKEAYSSSGAAVLADALGFPPSMGLGRHGHGIQKQQKSAFINALAAQFSGLGHEGFDASVDDASLIGAEPTDFNWIGILFQNATYRRHQITDDYFGTPSWCEDGMRAIGLPPEEEC